MAETHLSASQSSVLQNQKPPAYFHTVVAVFGLVVLCFAAYWPLLHAGYIWDDGVWLTDNPLVQHWNGLWYIWFAPQTSTQYYPLVYTAFLLQFKMWGLNPLGYHLVNIALQAINSILLWRILRLLGLKGAWVAAAVFAIHPIQVETVGWITEQKNLLSAASGLGAALLWIRWAGLDAPVESPVASPLSARRGRLLFGASFLFVLALLAKTDICTLPVVLLLIAWWKNGRIRRRELLSVVPWLLLGALLAALTIYIEHGSAEAQGPAFAFSLSQRLVIAGKDFWFYPFKLLWPHPLLAVYPRWDVDHFAPADWLFPIITLLVPVLLWLLRNKIGRGPFMAVAYYGVVISPVLGFVSFYTMIYSFVADHYQYLAGIGIVVLVVELAAVGWERFWTYLKKMEIKKNTAGLMLFGGRLLPITAASALLLELGTLTWGQSEIYQSSRGIWEYVLNYNNNSWFAWDQLSFYDFQAGDIKDGYQDATEAYEITGGRNFYADAVLGVDLTNLNKGYAAGMGLLELSLQLNPYQPYFIDRLASCYENRGDKNRALDILHRGLDLMPNNPVLNVSMGERLGSMGDYQAALKNFQKALRWAPMEIQCMFDTVDALQKLGRYQDALNECQITLEVYPDDLATQILYGTLLIDLGRDQDAVDYLTGVVLSTPNDVGAHLALAAALAKTGDSQQAAIQRAIAEQLEKSPGTAGTTASEPAALPQ